MTCVLIIQILNKYLVSRPRLLALTSPFNIFSQLSVHPSLSLARKRIRAHISLCNWERGMNLVSEWQMMYRRAGICTSSTIRSLWISTIEDVWLYTSRSLCTLGRELKIAMSIIYEGLISATITRLVAIFAMIDDYCPDTPVSFY